MRIGVVQHRVLIAAAASPPHAQVALRVLALFGQVRFELARVACACVCACVRVCARMCVCVRVADGGGAVSS